jgi:hypothetical protein
VSSAFYLRELCDYFSGGPLKIVSGLDSVAHLLNAEEMLAGTYEIPMFFSVELYKGVRFLFASFANLILRSLREMVLFHESKLKFHPKV